MIAEGHVADWFVAIHAQGCDCGGSLAGLTRCKALALDPRRDFVLASLRSRAGRQAVAS